MNLTLQKTDLNNFLVQAWRLARCGVFAALLLGALIPAGAATATWTGTTDGNWGTAANWGGTLPTFDNTLDATLTGPLNVSAMFLGTAPVTNQSLTFAGTTPITLQMASASGSGSQNLYFDSATGNPYIAIPSGAANSLINGGSGSIVLLKNLTVSNNAAGTFIITPPITGAFSVTKEGPGELRLRGSQPFSGGLNLNAGTLGVYTFTSGAQNTLGTGTLTIAGGTQLYQANGSINVYSPPIVVNGDFILTTAANDAMTLGGTMNLGTAVRTITLGGGNSTISGAITNTGGLTVAGAFALTLSGANTYGGNTTINSGATLALGAANVIPDGSGKGNLAVAGTLNLKGFSDTINGLSGAGIITNSVAGTQTLTVGNNDQTSAFTGLIKTGTGDIAVTKTGAGTLTLSGASTFTGAASLNGGIVNFSALNNLGAGTAVNFGGGTLQYAAGNTADISARTVTINTGGATLDTGGNNVSFASAIGNSGTGGLTKVGAGTLTFSGANTYTGGTTISNGTLSVASIANGGVASGLGASTSAAGNLVLAGGTLSYSGATASSDRSFTLNAAANIIDVTSAATTLTLAGPAASTNFLEKTSAGSLTLDPGAGSYSLGALSADGGVLTLKSGTFTTTKIDPNVPAYAVGAGARGGKLVVDGATLNITGGGSLRPGASANGNLDILSGSVSVPGGYFILGHNGNSIGTQSGGTVSAATVTHFGGVATNTLTGGTLTAGSILNNSSGAGQYFTLNLNGGILQAAAGTFNFINNSAAGGPEIGVQLGTNGATIDTSLASYVVVNRPLGDIPGQLGRLIKIGANNLYLNSNSTYTGSSTISNGLLGIYSIANGGVSSPLGASTSAAGNLVLAGGTLAYFGTTGSSDRNFTLGAAANIINVYYAGTTLTLGGPASSANFLEATGSGSLTLDPGAGSYSLGALSADGALLTLKSGTFTTTGQDPNVTAYGVGAGARGGTLVVNGATLNVTGGKLLKVGALANGNLNILAGTVTAPSLVLGHNGNAIGTQSGGTVSVTQVFHAGGIATNTLTGGTLTAQQIYNISPSAGQYFTLVLNGGIVQAAAGTVNLMDNGLQGGPEMGVQLGTTGATIDTSLSSATIRRPLDNVPGQTGQLIKIGANTLTLSSNNTFTGSTTVSNGTLLVNGSLSTGAVAVKSGATLGGNGTIGGAVTVEAGGMAVFATGGTLGISGALIANGNVVHLTLSNNVPVGSYPLATYNTGGSSGTFNSTPVLDSGSLAANTHATIVTSGGSVTLQVAANIATTTTTLATSGSPSIYGQSVTFTATVMTNGVTAANATSTYVFKVDGLAVATNAVASGAASYTTTALTVTTHTITAEYAGDVNYTPSTNTVSQTVGTAPLGITANNTNKVYNGSAFSGGNGVTYSGFVNSETAAVLAGALSYAGTSQGATNVGSYTIIPSGQTSTNYAISYTNGTLTISPASTSVGASSANNPSGYKDSVAFTATLPADATGNVVFASTNGAFSTNAVTGASTISLAITNLPRGTNLIIFAYSGGGNYLGSTNTLNQIVTNHPPVAVAATYYRAKGLSLKIALTNLLTNVTDADGDPITLQGVGAGTNSATILTNSTNVYYLPSIGANSNSNDSFTYTVSDGFGGNATANILVNVISAAGAAQLSLPTNGMVNITFFGIPNYTYVVQTTTNLAVPWWTLSTNTASTNGSWLFTDPNATNAQQYYRSAQP